MNKRIRIVGLVLVICFALVLVQLDNWQVRDASTLKKSPFNNELTSVQPLFGPRGDILSADGEVLATSVKTKNGYLRKYPYGSLFADITGYLDPSAYAVALGVEAEYNGDLIEHESSGGTLRDLLTEHKGTDSIVLTTSVKLQQVAKAALGGKIGAVVAFQPTTGAILAMYANPTYDPNALATYNKAAAAAAFKRLDPSSPDSPLVNGATQLARPPGSTFKIVVTSAMFDEMPSLTKIIWPVVPSIPLPETNNTLSNFEDEECGGDLAEILAQSCDTAYGKIGIELKAQKLYNEAVAFGFNKVPPLDLPGVAKSNFDPPSAFVGKQPQLAYSAIGQEDVTETALEDALVAGAIANKGVIMAPHVLSHVVDNDGTVVSSYKDHRWLRATSPGTAASVLSLMRGVVEDGTASGVGFPASLDVAAKTGTAETGTNDCSADWMIATAPADPGDHPAVAVAAVVPYQPGLTGGCDGTGALVAGPIVKSVLVAAVAATSGS